MQWYHESEPSGYMIKKDPYSWGWLLWKKINKDALAEFFYGKLVDEIHQEINAIILRRK